MLLPTRIESTTLGDVLGALHRERVSGTLEIIEPSGATHFIRCLDGHVIGVEVAWPGPTLGQLLREMNALTPEARHHIECCAVDGSELPLGDSLVAHGFISRATLEAALRQQLRQRLDALERVSSGRLRFRPRELGARRVYLEAAEFLHGRPRHRQAFVSGERAQSTRVSEPSNASAMPRTRAQALAVLGLGEGADERSVRTAFRKLASGIHPDGHGQASARERLDLARRFAQASAAYHVLVA